MRLLTLGDSWTYGIELWDPELGPQEYYFPLEHSAHDTYRKAHAWPYRFGCHLDAEVINLGWPSASNDTISRRLMRWLAGEGYLSGRDAHELFVVIGWTGLERKDFFINDASIASRFAYVPEQQWITVTPGWGDKHSVKEIERLSRIYYEHFCDHGDYLWRYINHVYNAQITCDRIGARLLQFQAFYENQDFDSYMLLGSLSDQSHAHLAQEDVLMWDLVDASRFYGHKDHSQTFYSWLNVQCDAKGYRRDQLMMQTHPTALGHELWADELLKFSNIHL